MVERSRSRRLAPVGTPREVVAGCKEYSARLKEKALPVKLHTKVGVVAEGTVSLETDQAGVEQIVVQAKGSQLFGLVKLSHRHVFKVGELERSQSTHTAFLRRSVKIITRGNEAAREEMLERSLSLIHEREAVDITCEAKEDCSRLAVWIDAKWSVAMLQKSFRGNPRIDLALRGRNKTLNEKGIYELIEKEQKIERKDEGEKGVDSVGYGMLPKLDAATKSKLQDDLLNGVHVTYHDLAFGGNYSRSFPRRLRFDCESKDRSIYLEASYDEDGKTIVQNIADLIQVGGGPSAHGPTAGLLRATQGKPAQREAAISLVFRDMSMDITCGTKQDAWELVLYFCETIGFDRGQAAFRPPRHVFELPPLEEVSQSGRVAPERRTPEVMDLEALGPHRAMLLPMPITLRRATSLDSTSHDSTQLPSPTFSTRYRAGIEQIGKDHATQVSASSGFGLAMSRSISNSSAGSNKDRSSIRPVHPTVRYWKTTKPRHHGSGVHKSGYSGVGSVPNSWVAQIDRNMPSEFSSTGPIPTPLPDSRGKKGRSVTPTPRRPRSSRTSDFPAAGVGQAVLNARDAVSVAASAGHPSSGDGRGGGGSQVSPGSSQVSSHSQQRHKHGHHLGGRSQGEPPSYEWEGRPTASRGYARPDGHSTPRVSTSHPQASDHHTGGRHRDEPASHERQGRHAAGRGNSRPDDHSTPRGSTSHPQNPDYHNGGWRGNEPASHERERKPPAGSSGAHRGYRSVPGDKGPAGYDPRDPSAGGHPRRSPRNRGMHHVEGPEQPPSRGTPKELQGPSKDARRRSTLNVASGSSQPQWEKGRRNTLSDSAGRAVLHQTERRTTSPRDLRHVDHRQVLPPREREPKDTWDAPAQRKKTPPRASHVESRHSRTGDEEVGDRIRSHPIQDSVAVQTVAPARRHTASLSPRPKAVPFSSPSDVFISAQKALEAESPRPKSGDERLRRRFGGFEPAGKPLSVSPPGDRTQVKSGGGERRSNAMPKIDTAGLEEDGDYTTYKIKEYSGGNTGHSSAASGHQANNQGPRKKGITSIFKNLTSVGGHRREVTDKSLDSTVSPMALSGSGIHRRHQRQGGRFFSNPKTAGASGVETFSPNIESITQGRKGGARSPSR